MKTISQLEDYHNEMEAQRIQTAMLEAVCHESEVLYCFSLYNCTFVHVVGFYFLCINLTFHTY